MSPTPSVRVSRRGILRTALVSGIAAGAFGSGRAFAVPGTAAGGVTVQIWIIGPCGMYLYAGIFLLCAFGIAIRVIE